jgi:hypothetical protein
MQNTIDEGCQFYQEGKEDASQGLPMDLQELTPAEARSYKSGYDREYHDMMFFCIDYGDWSDGL